MKKAILAMVAPTLFIGAAPADAPPKAQVIVDASGEGPLISRNLFSQFAEQLGNGVDNGIWVGSDSPIPNVRGIRSDVVQALRALKVPNVRWPGGCFADQYHWRDGIGPRETRSVTYNIHWGSPVETNQFGTHEYMDFIEQIGSDAHIVANVGTGTVQEAAQWLEYMTTDKPTTLGKLRAANGRTEPWRIKYFAYGNESYGCGGPMTAETYTERLKIFANYARNLNPAQSGNVLRFMKGPDPMVRLAVGPAPDQTDYTTADYDAFIANSYAMDTLIKRQSAVMDTYDPDKEVALSIDEWGVWLASTPGTPPLYLEQQSSLRDGIVAAIHLPSKSGSVIAIQTAGDAK